MSGARKILLFGGVALATWGMLYGLYYALLVEHQTLDRMGGSLATCFVQAAGGNWRESQGALISYQEAKYDYVRQVDVHSHWIGLAMLMIVLGAMFDEIAFPERVRFWIALALLIGSIVFPSGVILQTFNHEQMAWATGGSILAVLGSALVIAALAAVAVGFARQKG
jgi:hypothetical protein